MKLLRKRSASSGRQRQRSADDASPGVTYRNSGRTGQESAPRDRRQAAQAAAATGGVRAVWRFWLQRAGLLVLLIAIVICVVNILSLSNNAKIVPVNSGSSSFLRSQAAYQAAANKFLASSVLNRNKVTIDTSHFSKQMTAAFPELSGVSVALPLLSHRPVVYLQPAQPAMILTATNGSFVLDTNGRALLSSADLSSTKGLPQVADQSGLEIQLNHQVLAADDVSFIQTVNQQLAAKGVGVSSMALPAAASELDVSISGKPYFVKFNLRSNDARQQVGTYLAAIAQLQRQHVTPAHYVDVRLEGRAYYQ